LVTLTLAVLATWGLSALLYYWKGFAWLHRWAKTDVVDKNGQSVTFVGRQLQCFWCITVWVSVPMTILALFQPWFLYPFALTGASILLSKGGRIIWQAMQE
jgi:hypothetical protein